MLKERIWIIFTSVILLVFPSIAHADLDALDPEGATITFILLTLIFLLLTIDKQILKNRDKKSKKYLKGSIIFLISCLVIIIFCDEYGASFLLALLVLPFICVASCLLAKFLALFFIEMIGNYEKNRTLHYLTTNKTVKYLCLVLLLLALILGLYKSDGWIIYHEAPFKGKIIDAETKKPLAETVVVVIYTVKDYRLSDFGLTEVDTQEVITDKNGEFHIPSHTYYHFYPFARKKASRFIIFKSQYTVFPDWQYFHKYFPEIRPVGGDTLSNYFKKGLTVELLHLKEREEIETNARSIDIMDEFSQEKLPNLYEELSKDVRD